MKLFITLVVAVAAVSAYDLRANEIEPRNVVIPVGRITNGDNAVPGQFPYQVGLALQENILRNFWCGGSLISNEWVLTAAHCTDNIKKATVYLGATNRNAPELKYTVYRKDFVVHPDWDMAKVRNDIALIKIPATTFSTTIKPVKLPSISNSYSSYAGDDAIASGWGKISDSENNSVEDLQYAEMGIVSNRICSKYYGLGIVRPSNVCVATPGGVSTCQGDSGGPLVLSSTGVQVGLTSFGPSAGCTLGYPVVFTRVTSYLDWIHEHTNLSE